MSNMSPAAKKYKRLAVAALAAAPFNLIQGAVSAALFAGLSYILEKSAFYAGLRDELR